MTEVERPAAIGHMNADHVDAVLLYARTRDPRAFGGVAEARHATMTDLDESTMRLEVATGHGHRSVVVPPARPVTTLESAREVLVEMVHQARAIVER